jgi:cation diffusion facilitator family transporter
MSSDNTGTQPESMRTVVIALAVNIAVAVIKAVAGLVTASSAMLAEAAHSVGDCTTEIMLVAAVRRSDKPADHRHPFGYGKERYLWSLLAALTIFILGAGFSAYQGIHAITAGEPDPGSPLVGYVVIVLAASVEGLSLRQALGQARRASKRSHMTIGAYVRDPDDPTVKSVILEDSGALIGLGLALAGLIMRQVTGSAVWDGAAALAIAALLIAIAIDLARTNVGLLIGKQANPHLVDDIRATLARQDGVLVVVDVLTMMMGTGKVLVCARVDFVDDIDATEVEHACVRYHDILTDRFDDIGEVFIEPVPNADPDIVDQARARA